MTAWYMIMNETQCYILSYLQYFNAILICLILIDIFLSISSFCHLPKAQKFMSIKIFSHTIVTNSHQDIHFC